MKDLDLARKLARIARGHGMTWRRFAKSLHDSYVNCATESAIAFASFEFKQAVLSEAEARFWSICERTANDHIEAMRVAG